MKSFVATCGLVAVVGIHFLVAVPSDAAAEEARESDPAVHIATLNWPPYTGRNLPRGGAASAVVRAAFAEVDRRVRIRYWPWNRAIAKAKSGTKQIVGYFPGYHCHHDENSDFIASQPMGTAPLGFAEHVNADYSWRTLDDLSRLRIGTVVGYANTKAFDERVENGEIRVITSNDDATNLSKLVKKQVDYAAIDKYVMKYLLKTDPDLRKNRDVLKFDEHELEIKKLYICFRDDSQGRKMRAIFNRGLDRIEAHSMLKSYISELVRE